MASTSEIGHAKNVANLQDLINFADTYTPTYNPSKAVLQIANLNTLFATAQNALQDVINNNTLFNNTVNQRMNAYANIKSLSTRLIAAIEATDADAQTIKDAKTINRKIQGKRATPITTPTDPNAPVPISISTAQLSYDQLTQHLAALTAILQAEPTYTPNETDLQVATLNTYINNLHTQNNNVSIAHAAVSNARLSRNNILYNPTTGLVKTALDVKTYIKSIFGATSPQYTQVKSIAFRNFK